jgi:hypothetical protein
MVQTTFVTPSPNWQTMLLDESSSRPATTLSDMEMALLRAGEDRLVPPGVMGWFLPARQLYGCGGVTLFEERFLSVVRAKFRTKVVAGGRPPKLNETIATTERPTAEAAVDRAAVHEIPAAREH